MPIYEYRCRQCGEKFEKFVRSAATDSETLCPKCGSDQVQKVFSVFGLAGSSEAASSSAASSCGPTGG